MRQQVKTDNRTSSLIRLQTCHHVDLFQLPRKDGAGEEHDQDGAENSQKVSRRVDDREKVVVVADGVLEEYVRHGEAGRKTQKGTNDSNPEVLLDIDRGKLPEAEERSTAYQSHLMLRQERIPV